MRRNLGAICLLIVCGLLSIGLWPFNPFPRNNVSWLRNGNGIQFGTNATIYSSRVFEISKPNEDPSCSLEIWLEPSVGYSNNSVTILAFYVPRNPLQFRMKQAGDVLILKRDYRDPHNHLTTRKVDIEHAFRENERELFTLTSSRNDTAIYRNGALMNVFPRFGLSCRDFSGQLVIGGSPIAYSTWQGKVFGLALYQQELTPEQVWRHFAMGAQNAEPERIKNERILAIYAFSERSGKIVHSSVSSKPELYIPAIFKIPHKKLLTAPWEEFSPDLGYVSDILINIGGFVPLGFFLFAYLRWNRQSSRAGVVTILLGAIISLTIEVLQAFIPVRLSGVTDIITNTLGTSVGVILWRTRPVQVVTTKLRVAKVVPLEVTNEA